MGFAAHRDDVDLETRDRGQNPQHLFGLSAVTQREHDIAIGDDSEIAMKCVQRIEHHRRCARAGEGGGDLFSDVPGFPDSEDDHFAAGFDRFFDQIDRANELFTQPLPKALKLGYF